MSADNKTLADVQPGGRVRLADQAERARFEAFLRRNPLTALCAGTAWEVWQAALSAQPSPADQDARAQFEEYRGGDCERDAQGYYVNARTAQDWAMWQAALAARQPVGAPTVVAHRYIQRHQSAEYSVWLNGDADETYVEAERQGLGRIERAYATPPAQAVDLANVIDQIAQQWDGCSYDAVGETIDVGQAIRAAGKRLIDSKAVGNG